MVTLKLIPCVWEGERDVDWPLFVCKRERRACMEIFL